MVISGAQVVTTAGTRVQLGTAPVFHIITRVTVQAKAANAGAIYVGGPSIDNESGIRLLKGESTTFDFMGARARAYHLEEIWLDADRNGEGVTYDYSTR